VKSLKENKSGSSVWKRADRSSCCCQLTELGGPLKLTLASRSRNLTRLQSNLPSSRKNSEIAPASQALVAHWRLIPLARFIPAQRLDRRPRRTLPSQCLRPKRLRFLSRNSSMLFSDTHCVAICGWKSLKSLESTFPRLRRVRFAWNCRN